MFRRVLILAVAAATIPAVAYGDDYIPPVVGGRTYTQYQITTAKARYSQILSIVVEGKRDSDKAPVVLGSTAGSAVVFRPAPTPAWDVGGKMGVGGTTYIVRTPFVSSTGHRIGTIAITFAYRKGQGTARFDDIAQAVATTMARNTLSAKNAADPYPYDKAWGPTTYAQSLTEAMIAAHPDLVVIMIHATPPGGKTNIIIGSNIGRFGKAADEDDLRVIDQGSTNLEIGGDNDRFETELPLLDAKGKRIGALGLVFRYKLSDDKEAIHAHGLAIRDELAARITNNAALFAPRR
jgi:hypothetical protein